MNKCFDIKLDVKHSSNQLNGHSLNYILAKSCDRSPYFALVLKVYDFIRKFVITVINNNHAE